MIGFVRRTVLSISSTKVRGILSMSSVDDSRMKNADHLVSSSAVLSVYSFWNPLTIIILSREENKKVQVGKDQEKAQSGKRFPLQKPRWEKN